MASRVHELQSKVAETRRDPIEPALRDILEAVAGEVGVEFEVVSGGQSGVRRIGSTRHDHGKAADVKAFVTEGGKKRYLDQSKPADREVWSRIVTLSVASGATGVGAAPNYMGNFTAHIGFGKQAVWGKKNDVPQKWVLEAFEAGKHTAPLSIPKASSDAKASVAPTPAKMSLAINAQRQGITLRNSLQDMGAARRQSLVDTSNTYDSSAVRPEATGSITFVKVVSAGKGWTTVKASDGEVYTFTGARNWRNNNPGNVEYGKFARSMGAIGTDGRFAVFPSFEMGQQAREQLLFSNPNYKDKTISEAIARYAPAFENDTRAYASAVAKAAGVSVDTKISDLTPTQRQAFLMAQEQFEGFRSGKITTTEGKTVPASVVQQFSGKNITEISRPTASQNITNQRAEHSIVRENVHPPLPRPRPDMAKPSEVGVQPSLPIDSQRKGIVSRDNLQDIEADRRHRVPTHRVPVSNIVAARAEQQLAAGGHRRIQAPDKPSASDRVRAHVNPVISSGPQTRGGRRSSAKPLQPTVLTSRSPDDSSSRLRTANLDVIYPKSFTRDEPALQAALDRRASEIARGVGNVNRRDQQLEQRLQRPDSRAQIVANNVAKSMAFQIKTNDAAKRMAADIAAGKRPMVSKTNAPGSQPKPQPIIQTPGTRYVQTVPIGPDGKVPSSAMPKRSVSDRVREDGGTRKRIASDKAQQALQASIERVARQRAAQLPENLKAAENRFQLQDREAARKYNANSNFQQQVAKDGWLYNTFKNGLPAPEPVLQQVLENYTVPKYITVTGPARVGYGAGKLTNGNLADKKAMKAVNVPPQIKRIILNPAHDPVRAAAAQRQQALLAAQNRAQAAAIAQAQALAARRAAANQTGAAARAYAQGRSSYTSDSGAMMPTRAMNGRQRNTYGDSGGNGSLSSSV